MNNQSKIKALSIDLDGTLLNRFKKVSKKDLNALRMFNDKGGEIIINTGKSLKPTLKIVNDINKYLKKPMRFFSCLNGNIVYDIENKKIIRFSFINKETTKKLFNTFKELNIRFVSYITSDTDIDKLNSWLKDNDFEIQKTNDYDDVVDSYKINCISISYNKNKMKKLYQYLKTFDDIEVLRTHRIFFEIVKKDSNKGNSLKFIANKLNINLENIAAIGDSENDLAMFNACKKSFLVKKTHLKRLKEATTDMLNLKRNRVSYIINKCLN